MPETEPQTQQAAAPKVADWKKKFSASEKVMKTEFRPKYALAKSRLRAEHSVKGRGTNKLTHEQVALVYSIGNSFVNSVAFKMPNCNLTAREEVEHETVENTEIKVNDWLKDKKVKKTVKRSIWDAFLGGFGAVFIDYEYDDVEDPQNVLTPGVPPQIDPASGQEIAPGVPPQFGRLVLKNDITITRIRPDLVRFPEGFDFDNYQESPWLGFDVILPIDDIKNHRNWNKKVTEKIEGKKYSALSSKESPKDKGGEGEELYGKISYCLIKPKTALEKMQLLIFCDEYDEEPLDFIDFDKGNVGYPVKFIYFNPLDDDCSYPCGDPWLWESQLNAVDKWWRTVVRHVERSNPKTVYDSGAVDTKEVEKLKSNNDNSFVGLKNKDRRDLRTLFAPMDAPKTQADLDKLYEIARQLLSELSPKSGLSRGAEDAATDTATEAKIIQTGEMIDIDARIDDVKEYIIDIVLDVAGILSKALVAPIPVKKTITAPVDPLDPNSPLEEKEVINEIGSEGFTNKINADADVESMQSQNKDVLRKQLIDALGLFVKLQPMMAQGGINPETKMPVPPKTINVEFWIQRLMETMHIRNIEEGFIELLPQPAVQLGPDGKPLPPGPAGPGQTPETITGAMPQEATEAGLAQAV